MRRCTKIDKYEVWMLMVLVMMMIYRVSQKKGTFRMLHSALGSKTLSGHNDRNLRMRSWVRWAVFVPRTLCSILKVKNDHFTIISLCLSRKMMTFCIFMSACHVFILTFHSTTEKRVEMCSVIYKYITYHMYFCCRSAASVSRIYRIHQIGLRKFLPF